MRFTPGLLLALASSVTAQRFTNSSMPATESATATTSGVAPTGTAAGAQSVSLSGANLGPGASFVTRPDGSTAVSLFARNGIASFSIGIPNDVFNSFSSGDLFIILFEIFVELAESRKRADTGCTLDVTVDGKSVLSEGLQTGSSSPSTDSTESSGDAPNVEFVQTCGDTGARMEVSDLAVGPPGSSNPGNGNGGGSNPTETNSEGATTNSEGETVIPTETNTNSEGATTNSEGETITATGTETAPTSTATSAAGFPGSVLDFVLFGCVSSTNGFPTFELAETSDSMDLERCASLCEDRSYFGTHDTECYCGDEINDDNTTRVNTDLCDIECPGDDSEFCGGDAPVSRRSRRQSAIPNTILLTVYISLGGADVTLTNILTATITDQSTITTTFTTTIEDATTTETQTITAIYECYNGQCYPETGNGGRIVYIFKPYPGEDCDGQYVYVSEACSCKGGSQYVPKYCSNGDCHGLTVYKPEQCDDWYNYDVCYTPADCDTCEHGQVVYKPWENSYGTPDHPKMPELPTCSYSSCPATEHGSKPAPPCTGDHCESSGSKPAPPCSGDDCESSGSKPAPPCSGDDCEASGSKGSSGGESSGSKPAPPCTGADCEASGSKGSSGGEASGSKGSSGGEAACTGDHCNTEGSGSKGEAPCSGDDCKPTIVSSAGKQAVSGLALLAAVAAALL